MPSLIQALASVGVDYNAYAYHCAFPLVVATVKPGWAYIQDNVVKLLSAEVTKVHNNHCSNQ